MLDAGTLPVEDLVMLAVREGRRPRPIYQAHRWFARRFGSAFRALLTAAMIEHDADFWAAYHDGVDWHGRTVLDPFVGGGTSVVEAHRLGADVVGVDVDAVACAITRFELRAATMPDLGPMLEMLKREVGASLRRFYMTIDPVGEPRQVLHYFWVQVVPCHGCGHEVEAHPHYQLAYDAKGTQQWVFCPACKAVAEMAQTAQAWCCQDCRRQTEIEQGTVRYGLLTCPHCKTQERLIDVAGRIGHPPAWRLFALETIPEAKGTRSIPLRERTFQAATDADRALYDAATALLMETADSKGVLPWVPERVIPVEGRSDDRLVRYGYGRYRDLFNARQLLHLSKLAEVVAAQDAPEREALSLALSDHLITNCMLTHYAFGWRRLAPLFSVRAYRHIPRPVEINPWLEGTGRGTFPNAVRQVQRAIVAARTPLDALLTGGFAPTPTQGERHAGEQQATIVQGTAERLNQVGSASVDLILSDPPYFDNIAYSELSDFFLPWLEMLGLVDVGGGLGWSDNLAGHDRDEVAATDFEQRLGSCFIEFARVLKPEGRMVFTYQHSHPRAWLALARAIAPSGLRALQVFPLLGNTAAGLHVHDGTITWDAVFVLGHGGDPIAEPMLTAGAIQDAHKRCRYWSERLAPLTTGAFRPADHHNFSRACLVAAALGAFPPILETAGYSLEAALLVDPSSTKE